MPQRRYRRKRGNRRPGAGGRRAQEGRAAAGRTPSHPGRGSGCRGLPVGKSVPGGGQGPYSLTVGSQQGHLRRVWQVTRCKRSQGERWLKEQQGLPGHCGQQSPGMRTGCGQDSGGQRRARHCTLPLCERTDPKPSRVSAKWPPPLMHLPPLMPLPFPPGHTLTRQRHRRHGSVGCGKSAPLGYSFPLKAQPEEGVSYGPLCLRGNYLWRSPPCQVHRSPA